jgi:O-antigen ligase
MLMHAWVGLLQVALQHFVGLGPRFGELPVRPEDNWASVVVAGPVRLLRAYGLSGHPNVLGGHLSVGLILTYGLLTRWPRIWRALIVLAWAVVWVLLLTTFSRSAWLSLIVGSAVAAALLWRGRHIDRRAVGAAITLAVPALALAIGFVSIFSAFLVGRLDVASQRLETFSISERQSMMELAVQMIALRPLAGVGAANFSVASQILSADHLASDSVHNVPLLITTELGLPGLAAFLTMLISMVAIAWDRWRSRSITLWQALAGGGLAALLMVMQLDHYLWTAPQGMLLWAALAGMWVREV